MSDELSAGSDPDSRPDLPERVDRSSVADGASVADAALATSVVPAARRRAFRRRVALGVILAGTALGTGFLVAGAAAWWRPAEPFPVNDGLSVEELVAAEGDRLPDDPRADDLRATDEARFRTLLAETRADIDADRLEVATLGFGVLDHSLAWRKVRNEPSLTAELTAELAALHRQVVSGWVCRMLRCAKEGRLHELLVAHDLLTAGESDRPPPWGTLVLSSRQFGKVPHGLVPVREAWLTFAKGCVPSLDRSGLKTAEGYLRRYGESEATLASLWLHFAEESLLRGDREAADEALRAAELRGAPPERTAALAEPDGAALRVASGLRRLRDGAAEEATTAVFEALAIDRDAAIAALQEVEAAPLLAVALDSCQARFERAVTDEDWAAATEADSLARCLAPGSGSWFTEVLTGTRLQALGAEFVASLPAAAAAALPVASIQSLLPVRNSIGMDFELVTLGRVKSRFVGLVPVTFAQWKRVMGSTREVGNAGPDGVDTAANASPSVPGSFADDAPVHSLTWAEAEEFCRRLTDLPEERAAGRIYRMPSEAEWIAGVKKGARRRTGSATDLPSATPGGQRADQGRSEPSDDELGGPPVGAHRTGVTGRQPLWEWVWADLQPFWEGVDRKWVQSNFSIIDDRKWVQSNFSIIDETPGIPGPQAMLRRQGRSWPPAEAGKAAPGTTTAAASSDPSIGFRVVMEMRPTPSCEDVRSRCDP